VLIILDLLNLELPSDYYHIKYTLYNAQEEKIDSTECQFTVSPNINIPEPVEVYSKILTKNTYFFDYIIGIQFKNSGQLTMAEFYLKRSYHLNPTFQQSLVELINTHLVQNKYSAILDEVQALEGNQELSFFYHLLRGKAYFGLKDFQPGLECFLNANRIDNSDYNLINLIGLSYLKLGNKDQAIKAFNASLTLKEDQPLLTDIFKKYNLKIK